MESVQGVASFLGVDAHAVDCALKAYSVQGEILLEQAHVPTQVRSLRAALKGLPQPAWVLLEASPMAAYVKDAIEPAAERVIVCETRENRWIAKSEDKGDPEDADRLARLLRMGEFREVHVPKAGRRDVRELVRAYDKAVGDVTRLKNRIKSKYRQHGVALTGQAAYQPEGRDVTLTQVKRPAIRFVLEVLYEMLDAAEAARDRLAGQLHAKLKRTREYKRLRTVPGVGPVVASILVAVIDDPWRFATKRKLWRYAGLGVRRASSGNSKTIREGGAHTGNRLLKYGIMQAAHAAIKGHNRFARHYRQMIAAGIDRAMAKKTVARNILATVWAIWKNGTEYQDAF